MKKAILGFAMVALVAIGIIAVPAEAGPSRLGTITVTGSGSMMVKRDQATTSLAVSLTASKAADALAQATTRYNAVRAAILALGIKADDLTTAGISLYPEWDYSASDRKPELRGYRASISVQVVSTVPNAARILDAAVMTGGDAVSIGGVSFDVGEAASVTDTSRVRAVSNARVKARDYAEALGQRLGRAIKVVETSAAVPTPIWSAMDKAAAVEFDPGAQRFTSTVSITFELLN